MVLKCLFFFTYDFKVKYEPFWTFLDSFCEIHPYNGGLWGKYTTRVILNQSQGTFNSLIKTSDGFFAEV